MARARHAGVEIEYETFGDPGGSLMVLISGLGSQLLSWDEELCQMLAGRGFQVARFDNRDVGLSSKFDGQTVDVVAALGALAEGGAVEAPYLLEDMASDAAAVIEACGGGPAHVVGVSMGGMIAQALAITQPELVTSLCSIMSTTGTRKAGQPTEEAAAALMRPPARSAEEAADQAVATTRVIGSPGFPFDEDRVRRRALAAYHRNFSPDGVARQLVAVLASGDRTPALGRLEVPTLVIHGEEDPLVVPSGGRATAEAIPGARLHLVPGMGHELPPGFWPTLVDAVSENAGR